MNLKRAIQILSADESDRHPDTNPEVNEATKLGIEAMKRTKARREKLSWSFEPLLPGETEE